MSKTEPFERPIYVTQPLLPDLNDVMPTLEQVWQSKYLTNNGAMAKRLEKELAGFLKVPYFSLFSNGTAALQIACKVLDLEGEVITTPFTFAATPHSLSWCNLRPVFCDIEETTCNIDTDKIEALITTRTSAIMPVHVFGRPCRTDEIGRIAQKHGLKVIYDAAHAFGTEVDGKPIGAFGDITMFSFHATKVYHTIEGGGLAFNSPKIRERADSLRNFGILDDETIAEPGTNAKLNELQAVIGILVLKLVQKEIDGRRKATYLYRDLLKDVPGLSFNIDMKSVVHNYPYFVVRINREEFGLSRDELFITLKNYNIFARRYFYPLCSRFQCYRDIPSASPSNLPNAEKASGEVLALPLYGSISEEIVERICTVIMEIRKTGQVL